MRVVALIPARKGSKRVQNKNIRRLGDHPLIAYTIQQAVQSALFDAVIVSTNSPQIAKIAEYYGAEVPFLRPEEFASDTSPDIEWLAFTLKKLQEMGRTYDAFAILRPTSPFRKPQTIQRAWDQFMHTTGVDSIRAVEKVQQHPGKMWVINGDRMAPLLLMPQGIPWHSTPYQSLPPVYIQNASLEIAWARVPLEMNSLAGNVLAPFLTTDEEGFDINIIHDWMLAEALLAQGDFSLVDILLAPYPT